ncbi:SagB/ThcOx family dehydrogenase [Actinoplanes sp. NPDC049118]|uniref:SagB/ThcOx family dehydrogenase n=1 Tax=Actinoplanes sp. NPDC049118 TaxID=3155769 RepID=UPI0033F31E40
MIGTEEVTRHEGRLSAATMAHAVAADPQFRVPARPCLVPGLVCVPLDDGLAFVGSGNRQTALRGRTATSLIPRLLPALDGSRTVAELAGMHPDVTEGTVRACVSLLYVSGLLQDGPAGGEVGLIPSEVTDYLGRNLDTTRVNRNRIEACERLAQARVLIAGPGPLSDRLRNELATAGVDAHGWTGPEMSLGAGDFVVAVDDGDARALAELDESCRRAGVSWLRTAAGERTVEVGPLFNARHTCCHGCFSAGRSVPAGVPSPLRVATWAALTATEVVHLLSRVGVTPALSGGTVYDLDAWTQSTVGAYRRPGCPRCLPTGLPAQADGPALAHVYEQAVAFPPREWLNPKDHQVHYRPANAALQRYNKEYRAAPRVALNGGQPGAGPGLTRTDLSALLLRTAGLRDDPSAVPGQVSRWAPTGGNLGSVQAYLLALDVTGLERGWYFYQRGDHSLARIRALSTADGEVAAVCPALAPEHPAALLVLTGALGLVAAKYHDFAYRLVCLDAGVALAQLSAVADGYGLAARLADRWDDTALGAALRLEGNAEPVTAVVALNLRNDDDPKH